MRHVLTPFPLHGADERSQYYVVADWQIGRKYEAWTRLQDIAAIALPLICSKRVPTCVPSRCSSVTTIWKKPLSTSTFPTAISAPPPVLWTPWRWGPQERKTRPLETPK